MKTSALLFDLGNVVVEVDFERALAHWEPHSRLAPARLRELFHFDAPYQGHEVGRIAAGDYFAHLRELLGLDCDATVVETGWNAIFTGAVDETVALLDEVRSQVPCYALSNTNAVHIAAVRAQFPGLLERFHGVFFSHEIGFRKPHPAAFAHALERMSAPAAEVLFFDDLADNVEAAQALGMQGVVVRSPADVREALTARGLRRP